MNIFMIFLFVLSCKNVSGGVELYKKYLNSYYLKSDTILNAVQLLNKYNYTSETHTVITNDGYKLKVHRIPGSGPPILLVHGIADSSDSWLVLGPKYSLAYQLADSGYDVWLLNSRGNRYSKGHIRSPPPKTYWNFTYEEIGLHDLPATIDYILSIRNISKLTYIGYSQGTTVMFVMCSMRPEYNKKIGHAILLAPVAGLQFTRYPFMKFWSNNLNKAMTFAESIQLYEIFPFNEKLNLYHSTVCNINSPYKIFCELEYFLEFGLLSLASLVPERLPVITSHVPSGTSVKLLFHFIQGYSTEKFQRFDYGKQKNVELYSSSLPPEYDIEKIDVPLTVFSSEVDWFSDDKDVKLLLNRIKTVENFIYLNESLSFTHLEFVYGSRVNSIINKPVLGILEGLS